MVSKLVLRTSPGRWLLIVWMPEDVRWSENGRSIVRKKIKVIRATFCKIKIVF